MRIKATRLLELSCVSQVLEQLSCSTESLNAMMVSQTTSKLTKKEKKKDLLLFLKPKIYCTYLNSSVIQNLDINNCLCDSCTGKIEPSFATNIK